MYGSVPYNSANGHPTVYIVLTHANKLVQVDPHDDLLDFDLYLETFDPLLRICHIPLQLYESLANIDPSLLLAADGDVYPLARRGVFILPAVPSLHHV